MDLYKTVNKRKLGFMTSQEYIRKMNYEVYKKLFSTPLRGKSLRDGVYRVKFAPQATDFALYRNKLLMSTPNNAVVLYEVVNPREVEYEFLRDWHIPYNFNTGMHCLNWGPDGDIYTVTANDQRLHVIDIETMESIDLIEVKFSKQIVHHKPHPHINGLVAVATVAGKVMLVDLKSGNVTCTSVFHPKGVKAVSFCDLNQNLVVSASENCTCFWDKRKFRRPMLINRDNCIVSSILPSFEMVPGTDKVILLNVDRDITIWDVHKLRKDSHHGPFIMPFDKEIRYKFAITTKSDPSLLFMPANHDIRVYNLKTMDRIGVLQGHIMPVRGLIFNYLNDQLYSSSMDGCHAWVPKCVGP